jgi:Fe-S-cluster containining protein
MNTNLPVNPCNICPKPGKCCQKFTIDGDLGSFSFWKDGTEQKEAKKTLDRYNLPFLTNGIASTHQSDDREYVRLWYTCPELKENGRCSIYEIRPALCRNLMPGEGSLCVFYQESMTK